MSENIEARSPGTIWKGCCHSCNRAVSVAGPIGDDGLCDECRKKGLTPWWGMNVQ